MSTTDKFERMQGRDGYHVVPVRLNGSVSLYCQSYVDGELGVSPGVATGESSALLAEWDNPSPADDGDCVRLQLALDAVARYLTTGGSWEQLAAAMQKMRRVAPCGLVFSGYRLLDSYSTSEGTYQHIFVKDDSSGNAVLWEEPNYNEKGGVFGGFIDFTTLEEIRRQQEESAWSTADVSIEETSTALQLPDRDDPGDS